MKWKCFSIILFWRSKTFSVSVPVQVNHSPSFTTDSPLDREVKDALLYDTLVLINLSACDRRKIILEERRRVKDRLQQNRSREARWGNEAWSFPPRSHTHTHAHVIVGLQWTRRVRVCVLLRSFVLGRQVRGAATEPGSHGGTDGGVRGQTPGGL